MCIALTGYHQVQATGTAAYVRLLSICQQQFPCQGAAVVELAKSNFPAMPLLLPLVDASKAWYIVNASCRTTVHVPASRPLDVVFGLTTLCLQEATT